ncbi:MAG: hypothetical protein ACE5G8_14670, partial [Anaerolineae bacterium]
MPNLSALLRLFNHIPLLRALFEALADEQPVPHPLEVPVAARLSLLAALHQTLQTPILFITGRADRARIVADQLRFWAANPTLVLRLPDPGVLPYEQIAWNQETIAGRLAALTALVTAGGPETAPLVVASARALMQKTMPPGWLT